MKTLTVFLFLLFPLITFSQSIEKLLKKADDLALSKKHKKALTYYNKAIKKDTTNPIAYYKRGVNFKWMKEYEKAINDFRHIIKLKKDEDNTALEFKIIQQKVDLEKKK